MKVHLKMLGCRLNQAEIDQMARHFQQQGHIIVTDPSEADQVIVNTCAVTHEATRASRHLIREINRTNTAAQINVTGCYAQIAPDDIAILPGVQRVIDNMAKEKLVETIIGAPIEIYDKEPLSRDEIHPGAAGRTRAFVKVQDGCDNACTFCVTTVARGAGRTRAIQEVVDEIRLLHQAGYQEAVLTGVHLGSFGHDTGDPNGLITLVNAILRDTEIPRLRLSSLEPWDLSPEFFDLWENPRLCPHLHLPLQSGCDATLKRMRRNTSQAQFAELAAAARAKIKNLSITTDVIVGFPGETDEEFASSTAFIRQMDFSGLHVFRYSRRPGTPAAKMRGHLSNAVKKERSTHLNMQSHAMEQNFVRRFNGMFLPVLWEQVNGATEDGFINVGYTDNYIRVRCVHPRVLTNLITSVQMLYYDEQLNQMIVKLDSVNRF